MFEKENKDILIPESKSFTPSESDASDVNELSENDLPQATKDAIDAAMDWFNRRIKEATKVNKK